MGRALCVWWCELIECNNLGTLLGKLTSDSTPHRTQADHQKIRIMRHHRAAIRQKKSGTPVHPHKTRVFRHTKITRCVLQQPIPGLAMQHIASGTACDGKRHWHGFG